MIASTDKGLPASVNVGNIRFIKGDSNYSTFHLTNGKSVLVAKTLKLVSQLLNDDFIRPHKSYIVNTANLKNYNESDSTIEMDCGAIIPISRRNAASINNMVTAPMTHTPMKKAKKEDIVFFAPPVAEKPKLSQIDQIKGLFHYFGYEPTTSEVGGFMAFDHKVFPGNRVIYAKHHGCLCKVTFSEPVSGSFVGSQSSLPKTWAGLFTAVRNHTRRVITMFEHEEAKLKAA